MDQHHIGRLAAGLTGLEDMQALPFDGDEAPEGRVFGHPGGFAARCALGQGFRATGQRKGKGQKQKDVTHRWETRAKGPSVRAG
ncbi:MAG: hypothetical protein Kow0013_22730 [Pararhodobacter sp.]